MSAIQTALFDYGIMPVNDAINMQVLTQSIRADLGTAQNSLLNAGRKLIQAKEMLPHGHWQNWLSVEFDMSDRTAQNTMNVAREFSDKTEIISLFKPTALYALTAPSLEPEIKQAIIAKAEAGEAVDVRAEIAKMKADFNQKLEHENRILTSTQLTLNKYKSDAEKFEAQARELDRTLSKKVDQAVAKKLDEKVAEKIEVEKEKLQAEVDRIAEDLEGDYQKKIDAQQDQILKLKNDLTLAKSSGDIEAQKKHLAEVEADLATALKKRSAVAADDEYKAQARMVIKEMAEAKARLIELDANAELTESTIALLFTAAKDLEKLAYLFKFAAKTNQADIEDAEILDAVSVTS